MYAQLLTSNYMPNAAWERQLAGADSAADRLLGCEAALLDRSRFRRAVADRIRPDVSQPGRLYAYFVRLSAARRRERKKELCIYLSSKRSEPFK